MQTLEQRIEQLELANQAVLQRNKKVESDKAWEVSFCRRFFIVCITYIVASILLFFLGSRDFYLGAFVPVFGYILSTQSLPFVKKWWLKLCHSPK